MEIINKQLEQIRQLEQINKQVLEDKDIFRSQKLFKCILGLNSLETKVFAYLLKVKFASTKELDKMIKKDRSSIQRALQNLITLNLVKRKSISMKEFRQLRESPISGKRGYLYVYSTEDIGLIKKELRKLLDKWHEIMLTYLDNLDEFFECYDLDVDIC